MDSIRDGIPASSSVTIQTSPQSAPSTPSWLGEVALIMHYLREQGILSAIAERVHFARRRFGHYEVLDFVAVLLGYAISGGRTLQAFYAAVRPFASVFMALFGRDHLPAPSTLSRFLAALLPEPVEALRALFLEDILARARAVPVAGPRHAEATPGECAAASPQDRLSSTALEGLESQAASPSLHATAPSPTG